MNVMVYDCEFDMNIVTYNMDKIYKITPRFFYKLENIGGDYYFKTMPKEEVIRKAIIHNTNLDTMLMTEKQTD